MCARSYWYVLLAIIALSTVGYSQQTLKPLPKIVVHAKYVLVTTDKGYDLSDPNILPGDREAVVAVQNAIKKWGRYELAYRPKDADLILLVRKGRVMETQPQLRVGKSSTTPWEVGGTAPVDAGDPRDMLAAYEAENGLDAAPLWRDSLKGGLDTPGVALVQQLRKAVDDAAGVP